MKKSNTFVYELDGNLYINLTNRCSNACSFCVRNDKESYFGNALWLEHEPSAAEVIEAIPDRAYPEVVFCGFGEPTERFDVLIKVAEYVKKTYGKKTRINTNGVGNLVNGRDIVPEMEGLIDTISISLNNPHKDEYNALVRSKFGEKSFDEMISFAKECTKYIPNVVLTTVDTTISHEEEAECQKLCDEIGAAYRIRPWED